MTEKNTPSYITYFLKYFNKAVSTVRKRNVDSYDDFIGEDSFGLNRIVKKRDRNLLDWILIEQKLKQGPIAPKIYINMIHRSNNNL